MEYGLGLATESGWTPESAACLNPCFNGIWSRTGNGELPSVSLDVVLILVLMEYGLGQASKKALFFQTASLNPCFNGIWSRRKS